MVLMKKKILVSINNYMKGMHVISMVSMSVEDRYKKWNTVMFQKILNWCLIEISLPVDETQFSKTTITKMPLHHII